MYHFIKFKFYPILIDDKELKNILMYIILVYQLLMKINFKINFK